METTPVSTSTRTLKVRASKSVDTSTGKTAKTVTVKRKPKTLAKPVPIDSVSFSGMISTAAYYIAQQRNFAPGNELGDWLMAEQQVLATQFAKS